MRGFKQILSAFFVCVSLLAILNFCVNWYYVDTCWHGACYLRAKEIANKYCLNMTGENASSFSWDSVGNKEKVYDIHCYPRKDYIN
jgi:hypothetical protein